MCIPAAFSEGGLEKLLVAFDEDKNALVVSVRGEFFAELWCAQYGDPLNILDCVAVRAMLSDGAYTAKPPQILALFTHSIPWEISRKIFRERGIDVRYMPMDAYLTWKQESAMMPWYVPLSQSATSPAARGMALWARAYWAVPES